MDKKYKSLILIALFLFFFFTLIVLPDNICINFAGSILCALIFIINLFLLMEKTNKIEKLFLIYAFFMAFVVIGFFVYHLTKNCR